MVKGCIHCLDCWNTTGWADRFSEHKPTASNSQYTTTNTNGKPKTPAIADRRQAKSIAIPLALAVTEVLFDRYAAAMYPAQPPGPQAREKIAGQKPPVKKTTEILSSAHDAGIFNRMDNMDNK